MKCPFCGLDPYEYVDVGLGPGCGVPVAINCCGKGIVLFDDRIQGKRKRRIEKQAEKIWAKQKK